MCTKLEYKILGKGSPPIKFETQILDQFAVHFVIRLSTKFECLRNLTEIANICRSSRPEVFCKNCVPDLVALWLILYEIWDIPLRFPTYGKLNLLHQKNHMSITTIKFGHICAYIIYKNNLDTFLSIFYGALSYYCISLNKQFLYLRRNECHLRAYFGVLMSQL